MALVAQAPRHLTHTKEPCGQELFAIQRMNTRLTAESHQCMLTLNHVHDECEVQESSVHDIELFES